MKPLVSIIIVHYKVKKELFDCLSSIYESRPKVNFEIIVVDNDERKSIEKELKKKFLKVLYIKSPGNIGFGAGNNLGARYAKGEYLFFLNPDTKLFPNTLDTLIKFANKNKNVGAISPLLLDDGGKRSSVIGSRFITPLATIFSLSVIHKLFPDNPISKKFFYKNLIYSKPFKVDVFPGTSFLIKKEVFKRIGGFDDSFFLFFEEADLANKIKKISLNNYIVPQAKIIHLRGVSTKIRNDIEKVFKKSQFYYFKKWHGVLWAIVIQVITYIGKYELFLFLTLILGFFLRIYRLNETMSFIGDQGWFYLSARDMILTGDIPLVGITSSHVWLHQGPYWTYILAFIFKFFGFNPLIPGYFIAFMGGISIPFIYKVIRDMFEKNTAIISSFLYATSPLIVINDRFPYHTTLIPFFTILYIFSLFKWIKGEVIYFAWAIILLGILYNFELATFSLAGVLLALIFFGVLKGKPWVINLKNQKVILLSIMGLFATMLPILIYDIKKGFLQTFGFMAWIGYRILRIFGFPSIHPDSASQPSHVTMYNFLFDNYRKLVFIQNSIIPALILVFSLTLFSFLVYKTVKNKKNSDGYLIIGIYALIAILSIIALKTPSDAYLPVLFAPFIIITAIFFEWLLKDKKLFFPLVILLIFLGSINIYNLISNNYYSYSAGFLNRIRAVDKIIRLTNNRKYNLVGKGKGSQFESFTMNYEYLLWYKGYPPSKNIEKTKIIISENPNGIIIERR